MTLYYTRVGKRYHFESAHWLPKVPNGHKCQRLHGHNYKVEISIALHGNGVDETGFVLDFWELDKVIQPIIDTVDHQCLNDVTGLINPTAENIARWFMMRVQADLEPHFRCVRVIVWETDDCFAAVLAA